MAGYFSDYFGAYFDSASAPVAQTNLPYWPRGFWAAGYWSPSYWPSEGAVAPVPVAEPERPRMPLRSRTLRRTPLKVVRRRIETPEGPIEILVPDPFDETDLVVLLAALAAA